MAEEKLKVFIVDDNPMTRQLIRRVLSKYPTEIAEFEHGFDATKHYHKLEPEVAIVDWEMPFMDGIEVTRRIRKMNPKAFIVMPTSRDDSESPVILTTAFGA